MNQYAFKDASEARSQFLELVGQVADARDWSDEELEEVTADVDAAWEESDDGFTWSDLWGEGQDVGAFWGALSELSDDWPDDLPGIDELRTFIDSARTTVETEEEEEELGSASTIIAGTVEGSLEDIAELSNAAQNTAKDPTRQILALAVAGAFLILLIRR